VGSFHGPASLRAHQGASGVNITVMSKRLVTISSVAINRRIRRNGGVLSMVEPPLPHGRGSVTRRHDASAVA
jgi:hypothetical protein